MVSSVTPECDTGARIEAGLRHQIASDAVGLALVGAAVGQQQAIFRADAQRSAQHLVLETPRLLGEQIHQHQPTLVRELLGQALVGVVRQHMRDLMGDDGGELVGRAGDTQHADMHADLSLSAVSRVAGVSDGWAP